MLRLQAAAEQLRANARPLVGDARSLLQTSLSAELGATAQLNWLGDRAQVTLKAAPAAALARWLAQVRGNTHAVAAEVKLVRSSAATPETMRWDGTVALDLPADPAKAP